MIIFKLKIKFITSQLTLCSGFDFTQARFWLLAHTPKGTDCPRLMARPAEPLRPFILTTDEPLPPFGLVASSPP